MKKITKLNLIYIIRHENYTITRAECQPKPVYFFFFVGTNKLYVAICIIILLFLSRVSPFPRKIVENTCFFVCPERFYACTRVKFHRAQKKDEGSVIPRPIAAPIYYAVHAVKVTYSFSFIAVSRHLRRRLTLTTMKTAVSARHGRITR